MKVERSPVDAALDTIHDVNFGIKMNHWKTLLPSAAAILGLALFSSPVVADVQARGADALYTQRGTDPAFEELIEKKAFPIGVNSHTGVKGSKISVNHRLLKQRVQGNHRIPHNIAIHTLCNSVIPRRDFPKWTRWYQEDGNTQVFRLFKGEHNVRNSREGAPRVEAFSRGLKWQRGEWHEWEGGYTIVKPIGAAIFQAKNNNHDWGIMIRMNDQGDIILDHRRHQKDKVIARNMTGKSFLLKVRDNGHDYEVYLDGEMAGVGHYSRPTGHTTFRWGMYRGKTPAPRDAMIFVTGARFK